MKRIRSGLVLAFVLLLPALAGAQTFGQFTGAQTLEVNHRLFGAYVQSSENVLALLGQLRLSFYPSVDFGFTGGFARHDLAGTGHRTALLLGGDLKYQVVQEGASTPYSVAIDGNLGVQTGDHLSVLSLGPSVVASKTFQGNTSITWTPYASAGILFSNINVDPINQSDVSLPLRFGSELHFSAQLALTAELQLRLSDDFNDDVAFNVGVNSPF